MDKEIIQKSHPHPIRFLGFYIYGLLMIFMGGIVAVTGLFPFTLSIGI